MKFREALFFLLITSLALPVLSQEKTVRYDESFSVSPNAWVDLQCKYGDIHVDTWNENRVDVKVEVKADGNETGDVEKMLSKVKVKIEGSDRRVEVTSNLGEIIQWNNSSGNNRVRIKFKDGTRVNLKNFSITYNISMPRSNNLEVSNKYGDIFVADLDGQAKLWLKYGNLKAQSLNGKSSLEIAYGKGRINQLGRSAIDLSYSQLVMDEAQSIRTEAKYSSLEVEQIDSLFSDSKYNNYKIGQIHTLFGDDNYSNYRIGLLHSIAKVEMRYGDLKLNRVDNNFEVLDLEGSYTDFHVGLDEGSSFNFEFYSKYGNLSYPDALSVSQRHKENNSLHVKGRKGSNPGSRIKITTTYGNAIIK